MFSYSGSQNGLALERMWVQSLTTKKLANGHLQIATCMEAIHVANSLPRVNGDV
jgi:hypothetical protein